jgi:tRNA nucleotidyltransferase (CCA-adding enzyme)
MVTIERLAASLQEVLAIAVMAAEAEGWHLYLVGGGVRDLMRKGGEGPVMLSDLDLVVEGAVGAGVKLAEALRSRYPEVVLEIHGKFQTAALTWHGDPVLGDLSMDLATARTESYAYPAANPNVVASSIESDLFRRDFSVNAMALRLTGPGAGVVLDLHHGVEDLAARVLRVLHDRSLLDDPTRVFRGARFAARLGFEFHPETKDQFASAIASGIYQQSRQEFGSVPALQTRLRSEFKYLFSSSTWKGALRSLRSVNAFHCLHPSLSISQNLDDVGWRRLWRSLCRMDLWLNDDRLNPGLHRWQTMLELILAMADEPELIAAQLQLPKAAIDRLSTLNRIEVQIHQLLNQGDRPSRVDQVLSAFDRATLLLIAARSDDPWRCQIWKYLTEYARVKPILSGKDLQEFGFKPGKGLKLILTQLRVAMLDQVVNDRSSAIEFLKTLKLEDL